MLEAYFEAILARNRLITETMIRNQQIIAELFSRHLDFGADFLQHQMRVLSIVTQWRDPGSATLGAPGAETAPAAAETEPAKPALTVVRNRRG